nr:MAG TPA: hypothetical protein [Caudoviricetes sp.]
MQFFEKFLENFFYLIRYNKKYTVIADYLRFCLTIIS